MMHTIILLAGGNRGDVEVALDRAAAMVEERIGRVLRVSRTYVSPPWGFEAEGEFRNRAFAAETLLGPEEALDAVQGIERALGRDRMAETLEKALSGERYVSRTMDIDIMFYDDEVISTPRLTVPHPLLHEREFALRPLCEIAADRVHPVIGRTLERIYEDLKARGAGSDEI